jgi:hypothetical protein
MNNPNMLSRNARTFYLLVGILSIAGTAYLLSPFFANGETGFCPLHNTTGIPCPGCGTGKGTRALINLDFHNALLANPFSLPLTVLVFTAPFWIVYDSVKKKQTFFLFSQKANVFLGKRKILIPIIIMLLANWIWNFYKYL